MFELNKTVRTLDGKLVKPFAIHGEIIYCSDRNGNTIKKKFSDFSFSSEKEKEVISVLPSKNEYVETDETKNEDELFEEEEDSNDELHEPEEDSESNEEENSEDDSNSGNIWDDVDDDDGYI